MLTPILGRAGDILGKDRVLVAVMVALAGGTLICALAPSLPVMLLGRAIQGAGGAIYPLAFGIVRDQFPRERDRRRDRPRLLAGGDRRRASA